MPPSLGDATGDAILQPVADCDWPATNCYVDVWTLLLNAWRLNPIAALGMTVAQDYEGDQFTFFKYHHEDLEHLYGVRICELMIYPAWEERIAEQTGSGRIVLVEADGYFLPDTRSTSYHSQHTKTTIGIDSINTDSGRLTYFHNSGHYELTGPDYAGVFYKLPWQRSAEEVLPPYAELVSHRWRPKLGAALADSSVDLLRRHLDRRPEQSPIRRYREAFPRHMDWLIARPQSFHDYAFATVRQLGANSQLLGSYVEWLQQQGIADLTKACDAARQLSGNAKALQFRIARIANRARFDACETLFDALEHSYETAISHLEQTFM